MLDDSTPLKPPTPSLAAKAGSRPGARRIAAVWLPRMGAERAMRGLAAGGAPFATACAQGGAVRLASVDGVAQAAGLAPGMGLADARALRPDLVTRPADPAGEAAFLQALVRWAGRFSPWTAPDGSPDVGPPGGAGLALDVTGCAHLFGGETAMLEALSDGLARLGLTARAACADTLGAAWALSRYTPGVAAACAAAISADAPATRVRAPAPRRRVSASMSCNAAASPVVVAPPGQTRAAIADLPAAALRLDAATLAALSRLGLRTVGDVASPPRGGLARRFGVGLVRRLDQALGAEPEPVAAGRPPPRFAVRLSLPEPIGRVADVTAGLERLLARLCATLAEHGMGARGVRLTLRRVDRMDASATVGLAQPSRDPAVIAPLFARALEEIDAGFGVDALRLVATAVEPLTARQRAGALEATAQGAAADGAPYPAPKDADAQDALNGLLNRLGNRLGFEAVTRLLPADSHAPAQTFNVAAAAFAPPHDGPWPPPPGPRPLTLLRPEPAVVETAPPQGPARAVPALLRWRRGAHVLRLAEGPERIAPVWWLDDPDWRDGPRDYWRVETESGLRLWLYHTPASPRLGRWFVEGVFA